jgi:chemotaxis protein MotB
MSSGKQLQPIIIKRIKKGGHAAHGGAWKIAYADFVTAMMAFFLLMWLLGSTTEGDKKGIADYFSAPLKVALMGGPGSGASNSILPGGGKDLAETVGQDAKGDSESKTKQMGATVVRGNDLKQDMMRLESLKQRIEAVITNSPQLAEYKSQIRMEKVKDGLNIQIVDDHNRPMFDAGSAVVKPYMRDILKAIGTALVDVNSRIALTGHTDAVPYGNGERSYSNWELSADRANASRRELVAAGMPDGKLVRVVGLAASLPLDPEHPNAPINRRISVLVMTKEAEESMFKSYDSAVVPENGADAAEMQSLMTPDLSKPITGRPPLNEVGQSPR